MMSITDEIRGKAKLTNNESTAAAAEATAANALLIRQKKYFSF